MKDGGRTSMKWIWRFKFSQEDGLFYLNVVAGSIEDALARAKEEIPRAYLVSVTRLEGAIVGAQ